MSDATLVSTTLAGVIASATESTVTYPLEYLKTRQQLAVRPLAQAPLEKFAIPKLTSVFYDGWSPFIVGNVLRTVLRFNVFNSVTKWVSDGSGVPPSAPMVVLSGTLTGVFETLVVVPFESIKVTMIEASAVGKGQALGSLPPLGAPGTRLTATGTTSKISASRPVPQSLPNLPRAKKRIRPHAPSAEVAARDIHPIAGPQDMLRTIRSMYKERGLRAFVQGFNPTVLRQVSSSALRFSAWNFWKQLVAVEGEDRMSIYMVLFGSGATAAAEALVTQPVDTVKTRMQTSNALKLYGNSLFCAYRVFTEEGWRHLWAGFTLRWMRKWVSGGIVWAVYELSFARIDQAMRERPFR